MKILLGNNTLSFLAGSETWTYTLALALQKAGHQVTCYSPTLGEISKRLEKQGIRCLDSVSSRGVAPFSFILEEEFDKNFDVIIANHWHVVEYLRSQFPTTPIISTIHGILHEMQDEETGDIVDAPEHPSMKGGVAQFVAVSEEVQELLEEKYHIDSVIIRNFVDTKHFNKKKVQKTPKQILLNSNYATKDDPEVNVIREVAKHYGAKLAAIGYNFAQTMDTKSAIEDADIVVGMGRSVLEGVAMGRLGIVHGRWGTGGLVTEESIERLRCVNFSGRDSGGAMFSKDEFIEQIDKHYKQKTFDWGRTYVSTNHNADMAALAYVKIAESLLGKTIVKDNRRPFVRARDKHAEGSK